MNELIYNYNNKYKMNTITKKAFSSLYKYSSAANPRVFLTVANGEQRIGDLVFELYENRQPATVDNFQNLLKGTSEGHSHVGAKLSSGMAGLGISAGKVDAENNGAYGVWNPDGDLTMRHFKRGMLSAPAEGPNRLGGEFMITFNEAAFLDGYQTVFGELVEGEEVLAEIEKHVDRHGKVAGELTFTAGGQK